MDFTKSVAKASIRGKSNGKTNIWKFIGTKIDNLDEDVAQAGALLTV